MRNLATILILGTATLATGACGDDATTSNRASASEAAAFCESGPALDRMLTTDDVSADEIDTALEQARADAPESLRDSIDTIEATINASGDGTAMHESDYANATQALTDYFVDDCHFNHIDVTAVEYAFEGVPATAPAGPTVLRLTDKGAELHMAIVVRIADDYTGTLTDLIALPDDEADQIVTQLGVVYVDPDATSSTVLDLEPGRYALICAVPVGTTPAVAAEARTGGHEPEGDPHFTRGMLAELTVTT